MKLFGYNLDFKKVQDISKVKPEDTNLRRAIKWEQVIVRVRQDIEKWRNAIRQAESLHFPNRYLLMQTYKDVVLDAHLSGAMQQRTLKVTGSEYSIKNEDEVENKDLEKIFKQQWFEKFMCYALESKYYGFSLIQFGDIVNDIISQIDLIPRHYVKPEFDIVTQTSASTVGINYTEEPYKDWCLFLGEKYDLGLLMKAAPYAIWKKNTLGAWSEYTDLFGSPFRMGKTNVRDETTRQNMVNMMENMGTAGWGVFDPDDTIEFLGNNNTDAYQTYENLIEYCNKEISKLILGQTMTMDDGSSRSQSEVHERMLMNIIKSDKKWLENVVNNQLIPLMEVHGFKFGGYKFKFVEKNNLELLDQSKFDIELIKSGKYYIDPTYIQMKYGTPVEEVEMEKKENEIEKIENSIKNTYV